MSFEIVTALITPFNANRKIDFMALKKIINFQLEHGINKYVLFGTTGEGCTIPLEEKINTIKKLKKIYKNKIKIIFGISKVGMKEIIDEIKKLKKVPIDEYLVLTPFYLTTNEQGFIEYFNYIANHSSKPVMIYYVPKRTGQKASFSSLKILSEHRNITGIKYVFDNMDDIAKISSLQNKDFKVYLGNDEFVLEGIKNQLTGIISVVTNAYPRTFKQIEQSQKSELDKLNKIIEILFYEPNPIPIKYLMHLKGFCKLYYRLPLTEPRIDLIDSLKKEMSLYENKINW